MKRGRQTYRNYQGMASRLNLATHLQLGSSDGEVAELAFGPESCTPPADEASHAALADLWFQINLSGYRYTATLN